ncbi:PQQ-binding-like beta-propeller repeat protein [Streptomyces sp. NPDC020875]|uniref:outer membrane protein assembly factor BamB family protein n=1 Tax=Streptomyces sp. NPDC020875 TaxID=3154898 RepID=UPI0033E5938A
MSQPPSQQPPGGDEAPRDPRTGDPRHPEAGGDGGYGGPRGPEDAPAPPTASYQGSPYETPGQGPYAAPDAPDTPYASHDPQQGGLYASGPYQSPYQGQVQPPAYPQTPPGAPPMPPNAPPQAEQPGPYGQPGQYGHYGQGAIPGGEPYAYGTGPGTGHGQPSGYEQQAPGAYQDQAPGPYQQPAAPGGPYDGGHQQQGFAQPYQAPGQAPYAAPFPPADGFAGTSGGTVSGTPNGSGGGPAAGGRKRRTVVLVAASVAALLVVGGGTYALLGDDDGDGGEKKPVAGASATPEPSASEPSAGPGRGSGIENGDRENGGKDLNAGRAPGDARALFLTKNDVDLPRNGATVFGPWVSGDTVVKAMYKQVVGYSASDGRKKWTLPLEQELCSATPRPSASGAIVVGVKDGAGDGARCRDLRLVDLATGKVGWKSAIPAERGFLALSDHTLTISGDTLAAGATGVSYGFSMRTGKQIFAGPRSGCRPFAYAGGPKLLAAVSCPTSDYKKPKHQLQQVDPATGKARWTFAVPAGWEIDKVYSTAPVVVSLIQREPKKWTVVALKDDGKVRSQIAGGKDRFRVGCGGSLVIFGQNLEGCTGVAADASTLYMATEPVRAGGANQIVAFDLNTGRAKWRAPSGGDTTAVPLRMQGRDVVVYREPSYDTGGAVATIAPGGGAPKTVLRHPRGAASVENSFYSARLLYEGGRLFIVPGRVSASSDEEELTKPTMLAFGP